MGRTGVIDTLRDAELLDGVKDDNGGEFWATWRGRVFYKQGDSYRQVYLGNTLCWRDIITKVENWVSELVKYFVERKDYRISWNWDRYIKEDEVVFYTEKPKYRTINDELVEYIITDGEGSQYYLGDCWVYIVTDDNKIFECGVCTYTGYWWEIAQKRDISICEELKLWIVSGDLVVR